MNAATSGAGRYKVADERLGVFVGDTNTQPIRAQRAEAERAAELAPRFTPAAGVGLTWLDGRYWQWSGSAWAPVARGKATMRWSDPLALTPELAAWARALLEGSGREPVVLQLTDALALVTAERGAPTVRRAVAAPASLAQLAPPPVPEEVSTFRDVRDSMRKCAAQIASDYRRRRVVTDARKVIAEAQLDMPRGRPDRTLMMQALFRDQRARLPFIDDPHNTEHISSTEVLLCLDPDGGCVKGGDCDDQIVVLSSRAMAIGIVCRLRARRYADQRLLHVVVEYDAARKGASQWVAIDPSTESGRASDKPYTEEIVQTIDSEPAFVGLGNPPDDDDDETAATLGAVTPPASDTPGGGSSSTTPTQLDAATSAAWLTLLGAVKGSFDTSLADLETVATDYATLRTELGLAATDDASSAGAASTSTTPLADYIASVASGSPNWTTAAQAAEQKLLAAAQFFSTALADGISGARLLTYDQTGGIEGGLPDLFIASTPADTYRVFLVKDATSGQYAAQYFDLTSSTATATLGALVDVAIIAGAVAVISVAAAWAVHKYMDTVRAAHNDDMLQKINDNQTKLIASGQLTPAQAAAQTAAIGTTAAALNPPETPTSSNLATIAQWIAGGAAVVAAAYVASSVVPLLVKR